MFKVKWVTFDETPHLLQINGFNYSAKKTKSIKPNNNKTIFTTYRRTSKHNVKFKCVL